MKKFLPVIVLLALSFAAGAQHFDYNVNFDYLFSNYEYDRSHNVFDDSYTLHAARLTPEIGILAHQGRNMFHRVRIGADFMREMGEPAPVSSILKEVLLYYNLEAVLDNGAKFEAVAGCFPRYFSEGVYIGPFFDDDVIFYDNNIDGFFVKYRTDKLYSEFGLDWLGKPGTEEEPYRRERFQVLTTGLWNFAGDFNLGWAGSFYHFATAPELPNVVDNHLFNPWVEWTPKSWFDEVKVGAGMLFTYQCDRADNMHVEMPMGFYSQQLLGKWNLYVDNHFYFGDDLAPFYSRSFNGVMYGDELYRSDLGFHTQQDRPSWADFLTVRYEPEIANWFTLDIFFTFHFGTPSEALGSPFFRGWQQAIQLRFNLDNLRDEYRKSMPRRRHYRYGIHL